MKKYNSFIKILLLIVLAAMVLVCAGCGKSGEQDQAADGPKPVYWNLERDEYVAAGADYGTGRIARPDGYFYITFGCNGEKMELRCNDKTKVDKIDMMEAMCFDFDENGDIAEVYPIEDFGYEYYNRILFVKSVEGNIVHANNAPTFLGIDFDLELTEKTQVYSVNGGALLGYQPVTIQEEDELVVITDAEGDISHVFVKPYEPVGDIWMNVNRMYSSSLKASTREPDDLGYFTYTFSKNGELHTLRCRDQALANSIDKTNAPLMTLQFDDEGLISAKTSVNLATGGGATSSWYYVDYIDGLTFTTYRDGYGTNEHTMAKDCQIVNNTDIGGQKGLYTDLRVGDRVHCLTDSRGRICYILIVGRPFDGKIAYNVKRQWDSTNKVSKRQPNEDGVYEINMAIDGKQQIVKTTDKAFVDKLDSFMCYGVKLDENNYVTAVASASTVHNNGVVASYYDITELTDRKFTAKKIASGSDQGKVATYEIADDCEIYNVTDNSNFVGEATELQMGDRVHCFRGMDNKVHLIYIVNRAWEADIYWNINRKYNSTTKKSTRTPDADGWYWFDFAVNGKQVRLKTNDWATVNKIDSNAAKQYGILHWNGIITKVISCSSVKGYEGGVKGISWVDITEIEDKTLCFAQKYDTGKKYMFEVGVACKVYNVDADGVVKYVGEPTNIRVGDRVHAHFNRDGFAMLVFIVDKRVAELDTTPNTCACNDNVKWQPWDGTTALTSGNYYLTNDVVAPEEGFKLENATVNLRLDGHTISSNGRVFWAYTNANLNVCDHEGTGKLIGSGVAGEAGGVLRTSSTAKVNFWNLEVISDATEAKVTNGGLISAYGKITMHNCTFTGGKTTASGGSVYVEGTFRAFDCIFEGGESGNHGGNFYVAGGLYLNNTIIRGGSAPNDGDNLYLATSKECIVENVSFASPVNGKNIYHKSGNLGVSGKLTVTQGSSYKIKQITGYLTDLGMNTDSRIVVTRQGFGTVIQNAAEELLQCVTLENKTDLQELAYENGDIRIICTDPKDHSGDHCICAGGDMGLADHTCTELTDWKPLTMDVLKTSTTGADRLMFKESGNYYLSYDLDLPGVIDIPANQTINICLNGLKLTSPNRAFMVVGTLNITDCANTGIVETSYDQNGGVVKLSNGGTFNLYGGTLTCTKTVATGGGSVVVSTDGYGGLTSSTKTTTTFNMYGGKLSGSKTSGNGGNVTLFHENCYFNMYGGIVENGVATKNAGNIRSYNNVKLLGGTITGGKAVMGNDVYFDNGELTLGGNLNLGSLTIAAGKTITIHDGGLTVTQPIKLTAAEGVFATNVKTDLSGCFKAAGFDVIYDAEAQTLSLKGMTHTSHCVCMNADLGMAAHTCTAIGDWKPLTEACFTDAGSTGLKLLESGNYFLTEDLVVSKTIYNQFNHDVNICLNGYTISCVDNNVFTVSGKLTITDCVGTGKVQGNSVSNGGCIRMARGGELNIYAGTYANSQSVANGGGVLILSRDRWSATGATTDNTENKSVINLYGGLITGGMTTANGGNVGSFHAECVFNMYGGTLTGGIADGTGGNLKTAGIMNLFGGTITGGTAPKGNDIYYNSGTLTLGGNLNIDSLTISGKKLVIHDDGLTVVKPIKLEASAGVFATNVKTDLSACFEAPTGLVVAYNEADQTLELKAAPHKTHCACNGADLGLAAHSCEPISDWIPLTTDLFDDAKSSTGSVAGYKFKESGHYVLTADLSLSKAIYIQKDQNITICLNGHKLSRDSQLLTIGGTLTICDCEGTGACESSYASNGGTLRLARGGVLNVYGGTYTNLKKVSTGGAVVVVSRDVYSATGSTADNSENKSVFNFYGGKLTGGQTTGNGGNLTVFHAECTFNMYGGIIENGQADGTGGNVRAYGTINLLGGTIIGGTGAKGNDVYMNSGTLTIGGNLNIGSIYLNGKSFKIHSSGLTTETPIEIIGTGKFATNVLTDLSACFKAAGEIVYDEEAKTLTIQ